MKKIKLLAPILTATTLAAGALPLVGCSCKQETKIKPELVESSEGVVIKEHNIQKGKESTITLELPSGKVIKTVEVKIGNKVLTKDTDYKVDSNNIITIKADVVTGENVTVKVIVKDKVTGLNVTYAGEYHDGEAIKASNVTVKATMGLKTSETPLVWGTEYSITKDGESTPIANFDTAGYTFTQADVQVGHVDFKITYLDDTSITSDISVLVTSSVTKIELTDEGTGMPRRLYANIESIGVLKQGKTYEVIPKMNVATSELNRYRLFGIGPDDYTPYNFKDEELTIDEFEIIIDDKKLEAGTGFEKATDGCIKIKDTTITITSSSKISIKFTPKKDFPEEKCKCIFLLSESM